MDGKLSISPHDLYARLGTAATPVIIDVRRPADFATTETLIVSAEHRSPEEIAHWRTDLPAARSVVVY